MAPYFGSAPAQSALTSGDIADGAVNSDEIATGAVDLAHLSATGTASSSTFLRGDNSFASAGLSGWSEDGGNNDLLPGSASAGIYLGVATATAANLLSDYEEGVYTATLVCQTSGGYNLDSSADLLSYTKIGRLVHVTGYVNATSESGTPSGQLRLSLPFTILDGSEASDMAYTRDAVAVNHADGPAVMDDQLWLVETGTAFLAGYWFTHDTGTVDGFNHDDVDTGFQIHVNLQYHAA